MAYLIETTTVNDYRCGCCVRRSSSSHWIEDLEEALKELPKEFPVIGDWGGTVGVVVRDGSTSKIIAESQVSWPPQWQRGDPYKYTMWTLFIDEEAVPGQGCYSSQIISGTNSLPEVRGGDGQKASLRERLVTDKTWSQICDELREARRKIDLAKAEADLAEAQKRIKTLAR